MALNNIIVNILGDNSSLNRAVRQASRDIAVLNNAANSGIKAVAGIGAAMAAVGAAGVAAGAVAAGAVVAMTAAIGGGLIYFAAKNQEVKDSFTGLKNHVTQTMGEMTKPLVEPLKQFALQAQGAFDALTPSLRNITSALAPMIAQIGEKLTPLAQKLGPMLESAFSAGQGPLMALIDGLGPVIDGFNGFFTALNKPEVAVFVTTLMTTIGQLLPIIGQLLVALTPIGTAALPVLVTALQSVSDIIQGVVIPAFTTMAQFMSENPGLVQGIVIALIAFKVALVAANAAIAAYTVAQTIIRGATLAWAAVQWVLNASMYGFPLVWIIAAVIAVIAIVILLIKNWDKVVAALNWLWQQIQVIWDAILNFIKQVCSNIWNWVTEKWNSLVSTVVGAITGFYGTMIGIWGNILSFITSTVSNIWNAVVSRFNAVRSTVTDILNNVIGFIAGLPGRFYSMGIDLIQGLINGVKAMASRVASAAKDVVMGAVNAAKSALGIGSPSKLFRQYGVWTGEGYVIGVLSQTGAVAKSAQELANAAAKPMYKAGLSLGEELALGFNGTAKLNIRDGRMQLDAAVMARGTGNTFNVNVQAGISSPEETGRAVVSAIATYERINGSRWRE